MTRTFDADQSPLWVRSELVRVDLIHLITYTNRDAKTIDTEFYFARSPVLFDWNNTGSDIEFWPLLQEISALSVSANHLPNPVDTDLFNKPLEITLSNEPFGADAERLINTLRDGHVLENARLEWAQIALSARPTGSRIDLSDLAGDEHTFWYRGRVSRPGPITQKSIILYCVCDLAQVGWLKDLDQSKNDPKDYGRRLPVIYGSDVLVRANGSEVGWATTLAETITDTQTGNVDFTDVSGLSGSGITLKIGNEEVTATYVDDTTLNITARGQSSTTATGHGRGEIALEMITTVTFSVAGHAVSAINEVYIRNPASGELVRIPSGYTANTADVSFVAGETRATIQFTTAQLRTVLEEAFGDVDFSGSNQTINLTPQGREIRTSTNPDMDYQNFNTPAASPQAVGLGGSGTRRFLRCWFPVDSIPDSTREVVRARLRASGNCKSTDSGRSIDGVVEDYDGDLPGFSSGDAAYIQSGANAEKFGDLDHSTWRTPSAGTTLADYETDSPNTSSEPRLDFRMRNAGGTSPDPKADEYAEMVGDWGVQFEVYTAADPTLIGNLVGFNLELWARVDGYIAPVATPAYKAGSGNLMTKPCDIMRHWIEGRKTDYGPVYASGLTSGFEAGLFTDVDTDSVSPLADTTVLASVYVNAFSGSPGTPTVTGGGMSSWTLVDSASIYSTHTLFVFRASDASPGSGVINFDFGAATVNASWSVVQFPGTDVTSNDGVVQSADDNTTGTTLTVTLGAFSDSDNATFGVFGATAGTLTKGSGFTLIHEITDPSARPIISQFTSENDTSVDATLSPSGDFGGVAVELAAQAIALGEDPLSVDSDSYDDCATNLDDNVWAFDARTLGSSYSEVLARMAFEARTNVVMEEASGGTVCKLLTANSSYQFPAASGSISEWDAGGFVESPQDVTSILASRFSFSYAPDWSRGSGEEAFTQVVVANEDQNDLTTPSTSNFQDAADYFGSIEAEPMAFFCIQEEATAEEIAGYYCHERIRVPARLFAISGVTWWEAYALEVGDIINVTPPWSDSAVKCRVIEYTKDPSTEQIELRLVEVE